MAPQSLAQSRTYADLTRTYADKTRTNAEIVIVPPFIYLSELSSIVGRQSLVKLGSQDVFWETGIGAYTPLEINRFKRLPPRFQRSGFLTGYTGEISAKMLKNLGVEYVIIGHSERRKYLNETDEMINKKVKAALKAGLKVILCVGEYNRRGKGEEGREKQAKDYVKKQLQKDLKGISSIHFPLSSLIVAYEPVWAISTSKKSRSDTPEDAAEMIKFIKKTLNSKFYILNPRVLYGGSVDSKNIADFLKHSEINGVLVGGASLKAKEVRKIIEIASSCD